LIINTGIKNTILVDKEVNMNISMIRKGAAISAIVAILGTTTAFAQGNKDSSDTDITTQQRGKQKGNQDKKGQNMGQGGGQMGNMKFDAMGTITSITENILTLENADGDIISVDINPLTKIVKAPTEEEITEMETTREEAREARRAENAEDCTNETEERVESMQGKHMRNPDGVGQFSKATLSTADLTVGDWVSVKAFESDTVTLEGQFILVVAK